MPITTTPSGGPQGEFSTYTPIYATTISGTSTSSITFSSIPSTYTDLHVVVNGGANTNINLHITFNGDSGANYSYTYQTADGTTVSSGRSTNNTKIQVNYYGYFQADLNAGMRIDVQNYSNTTTYKTTLSRTHHASNGVAEVVGMWRGSSGASTEPITSMTLTAAGGTFAAGTTLTLYGIKAAFAPFTPTKASGGDIIVADSTYAYHAFLSTGTFRAAQSLTADLLVIAGGGGGGAGLNNAGGGGGGAGGVLNLTSQSLSATSYAVTVGSGGAGNGSNGTNSQFGALTAAVGGGGGGGPDHSDGNTGGSGGGGRSNTTTVAAGTSGQGFAGGAGNGNVNYIGGGGGGAGGVGTNGTTGGGGNGGVGTNAFSSWATATNTGLLGYYAGGGGASSGQFGNPGNPNGGAGGGGQGGFASGTPTATPGVPNTGSGGGGQGSWSSSSGAGGTGGSGIVIVRYLL